MRAEAEREELDYVVIRQYGPGDYEALKRLYLVNWPTKPFRSFITENVIREWGEMIFIAESGAEMVGSFFYAPNDDRADLHSLIVKKECRKQGIAAEMLQVAEEQADADGFAKITIEAENDILVGYYESLGFRYNPNVERGLIKDISTK